MMERSTGHGYKKIARGVLAVAVGAVIVGSPASAHAAFSLADLAGDTGRASVAGPDLMPGSEGWDVLGSLGGEAPASYANSELARAIEAQQVVTHEAAGLAIDLPSPLAVFELPGIFVAGAYEDLFVMLSQDSHDFAHSGGDQAIEAFFADCEEQGLAAFSFEVGGGAEGFGRTIEEDGMVCMDLYVPTTNGDLANLWIEYPTDQGDAFIASSALIFDSLRLADVPAAVLAAQGISERVESDGLSFAVPGMVWDANAEGWIDAEDGLLFAYTLPDVFAGDSSDLSREDLDDYAAWLVEPDGLMLATSVLVNGVGDHVYVYAALDESAYMEVYALVPLADGTVTMLAALCDGEDPAMTERLAVMLQSVAIAETTTAATAPSSPFGGLFGRAGAAEKVFSPLDLLDDAAFVASSKLA